jgi:hypothetical protein
VTHVRATCDNKSRNLAYVQWEIVVRGRGRPLNISNRFALQPGIPHPNFYIIIIIYRLREIRDSRRE